MLSVLKRIFGEFKSVVPETTLQTIKPDPVNPTGLLAPGLKLIHDQLLERGLPATLEDHRITCGPVKLEALVSSINVGHFVLRVEAPVPAPFRDLDPDPLVTASKLNLLAGLSAFTVRDNTLLLTAQLSIRTATPEEIDERWTLLYIRMITEVIEEAYTWKALHKALTSKTPPAFEKALTEEAWDEELNTVPEIVNLNREYFIASCTIPVTSGISTHLTHDSALLEMNAQDPHPGFGPGLRAVLTLPNVYKNDTIAMQLANRLNQCETEKTELSPFGGAWVKHPTQPMICFVSFWPAHWLKIKTWSHRVILWNQARAQWGYELLMTV